MGANKYQLKEINARNLGLRSAMVSNSKVCQICWKIKRDFKSCTKQRKCCLKRKKLKMFGGTKCSCMFCIFISHLVICNCNPLGVTSPLIEKHLSRHFKPQAFILNNETKGITSNLIKNGVESLNNLSYSTSPTIIPKIKRPKRRLLCRLAT